jgi:hypothetical protein
MSDDAVETPLIAGTRVLTEFIASSVVVCWQCFALKT